MDLHLVNSEAAALAFYLADTSKQTPEQLVLSALKQYAGQLPQKRVRSPEEKERLLMTIDEIADKTVALPILDSRHPDEILYDEDGLPR